MRLIWEHIITYAACMKKETRSKQNFFSHSSIVLVAFAVLLLGLVLCTVAWSSFKDKNATKDVMPYVDGDVAASRVSDFYHQLITNPSNNQDVRRQLLGFYGTENLLFYDQYYQHGFDPITCSSMLPIKVTTSLVSTGPTASINALADYPDNTSDTILVTAVLRSDGLKIDSVTCPDDKGGLPPAAR